MKILFWLGAVSLVTMLGCTSELQTWQTESCQSEYDRRTRQEPVTTHAGLNRVLKSFEARKAAHLDPEYQRYAGLRGKHWKTYKNRSFYVVKADDQFKFLVGRFRVRDFLPHKSGHTPDRYFERAQEQACLVGSPAPEQYLLMDAAILHKFLDLIEILKTQNYDHRALEIYHGFRAPKHNHKVGGADKSQHLWGKAIDFRVKDINRDGRADMTDKKIVLGILEKTVIGNGGGIGRYLDTPTSIHMDVRGWKARWDR